MRTLISVNSACIRSARKFIQASMITGTDGHTMSTIGDVQTDNCIHISDIEPSLISVTYNSCVSLLLLGYNGIFNLFFYSDF